MDERQIWFQRLPGTFRPQLLFIVQFKDRLCNGRGRGQSEALNLVAIQNIPLGNGCVGLSAPLWAQAFLPPFSPESLLRFDTYLLHRGPSYVSSLPRDVLGLLTQEHSTHQYITYLRYYAPSLTTRRADLTCSPSLLLASPTYLPFIGAAMVSTSEPAGLLMSSDPDRQP